MSILTPEALLDASITKNKKPARPKKPRNRKFVSVTDYQKESVKIKSKMTKLVALLNGISLSSLELTNDILGDVRIANVDEFKGKSNLNYKNPLPVTSIEFKKRFLTFLLLHLIDEIDHLVSNISEVCDATGRFERSYSSELKRLQDLYKVVRKLVYDLTHRGSDITASVKGILMYPAYTRMDVSKSHKVNKKMKGALEIIERYLAGGITIGDIKDDQIINAMNQVCAFMISLSDDIGRYIPSFDSIEGFDVSKYDAASIVASLGDGLALAQQETKGNPFVFKSFIAARPDVRTTISYDAGGRNIDMAVLAYGFIAFMFDSRPVYNFIDAMIHTF